MMEIFVNDAPVSCEEGATVSEVLAQEGITPVNIAVAVNESVVPKSQWKATKLTAGARLLVIKAVQGG